MFSDIGQAGLDPLNCKSHGASVGLGKSFPCRPWLLIQQMEKAAVRLRGKSLLISKGTRPSAGG